MPTISAFALLFFFLSAPSTVLLTVPEARAGAEWDNETEAGLVLANGNSHSETYSAKSKTEYSTGPETYSLSGNFLSAKAKDVKSAESWLVQLRYEHAYTDHLSGFLSQGVEGDRFAGILQRYNSDIGAKYYFYAIEGDVTWFGEFGYRFTREHRTTEAWESLHKARLYTEFEKYWSEAVSSKLWVEYIPTLTRFRNWLLNTELSLSSELSTVLSIKSAILLRYNNTPALATTQKSDTTFTTALVAKF